jgi:hypothetical protein
MGRKIDLINVALWCLTGMLFCTFLQSCKSEFDFIEESLRPGSADAAFSNRDMTVNFSSAAGSASVDIKATDDWNARFVNDRTRDWCSISTESGKRGTATINISVKDNNEYDTRSASIIFTSGKSKLTISVAQKQKDAILVSGNRLDVPKEGGQFTIDVSSNIKFDCHVSESAKSWITLLDTRSGLSESKVILRFSANDAIGKREGDIVFSSGQVSETVKVYQDGEMPTIILSPDDIHVSPSSSKFSVEVRSNIDVKVEIPSDVDWIHEFKTRSLSSSTYEFITSDNDDFNSRSCLLKFSSEEWEREEFLSVTQDRNPIVVSPKTVKVSGRGCTLWIATSKPDKSAFITKTEDTWLSPNPMQDDGMIPVEIQALEENGEARSGFILVYHKSSDVPDTVVVHQHEICPSFSYSTTSSVALAPVIGPDPTAPGFILWGDGTCDEYSPSAKHLYSSPGPHIITVEIAKYFYNLTLPAIENGMTVSFREIRTLGTYGNQ